MDQNIDQILDQCIERLMGGAPLDELLSEHPEHAETLGPALRSAQLLRTARAAAPSQLARTSAMGRMVNQLSTPPSRASSSALIGAFRRSPRALQAAAIAGSIALFGVAGVGASAATGNGPEPVRSFFGLTSSTIRVELEGVIAGIDTGASTLDVTVGTDTRVVHVDASTKLTGGGDMMSLADFAVGDSVEVKGSLQPDDTILATRVHLEDGAADETPDGDDASETPDADDDCDDDATKTPDGGDDCDDDDDDNEDNSGPGNADDDGDDDDDSGPGNADDDGDDEDNSGPGNADDDGDSEDNSGPENGDDDGDNDDNDDVTETPAEEDKDQDDSGAGTGGDHEQEDDGQEGGDEGGSSDD